MLHNDTTTWLQWEIFCLWIYISPKFYEIKYPVTFLKIFTHKVHIVLLVTNINYTQKRSVDQYTYSMGKYLWYLVPHTPVSTLWDPYTFVCYNRLQITREKTPHPPYYYP